MSPYRPLFSLAARPLAGMFLALLLASCAAPLRAPSQPDRETVRNFSLDARFALRLEQTAPPGTPAPNASGRLFWQHTAGSDRLLFSSPLGQGIAELESTALGACLRLSSGEKRCAPDAGALLGEYIGHTLPLDRLPAWLLGQTRSADRYIRDHSGRPKQLQEAGWHIDYDYDDNAPGALPAFLVIRREGTFELRLRIEEWRINP